MLVYVPDLVPFALFNRNIVCPLYFYFYFSLLFGVGDGTAARTLREGIGNNELVSVLNVEGEPDLFVCRSPSQYVRKKESNEFPLLHLGATKSLNKQKKKKTTHFDKGVTSYFSLTLSHTLFLPRSRHRTHS